MEEDSIKPLLPLKGGIQRKLFLSHVAQLAVVLGVAFSIVMTLDLVRTHRYFFSEQRDISKAIVAKGSRQIQRTRAILGALEEPGSAGAIREIIGVAVESDPEILYGIYMDVNRRPLASVRSRDSPPGAEVMLPKAAPPPLSFPLQDEMSLWASTAADVQYKVGVHNGDEVIEFVAPVVKNGVVKGTVRFGISTRQMNAALHEARQSWRKAREVTILLFLLLGFFTFIMAIWYSSVMAQRITKPITALTASAIRIANGDYRAEIKIGGEDEVAVLAEAFATMQVKIKGYMGNLQMLADEKVRQIRDILDNVKQGLFTFNLNLTVNPDCSLSACEILGMDDMAGKTLAEVFRLGTHDVNLFRDWVDVVLKYYRTHRWEKLVKLAPVQEISIGSRSSQRRIRVEYQKILDANGNLIKIMALVQDVTETKLQELHMKEEKIRLENKVKTILGITSNPPEVVSEFLKDSTIKINSLYNGLGRLEHPFDKDGLRTKEGGEPEGRQDFANWVHAAYKDCHTIKGNAGAFGFEALMAFAHDLETQLDHVGRGKITWSESFPAARRLINEMREEIKRMHEIHLLLTGNSEEAYVRLPESKVLRIRELAGKVETQALSPELLTLVEYCKRIANRGFFSLAHKYQDLVSRVAVKLGKEVEFAVYPRDLELDPELLFRVDEALVHLLRNAVVHGIENAGSPQRIKKGIGRVDLTYARSFGGHVFSVKDNGQGIDREALVERAITSGIWSRDEAEAIGNKDQLQLIFFPGFSTSEKPDALSGRGMGLTIAKESLKAWGGGISVETTPGLGSVFTISLPA